MVEEKKPGAWESATLRVDGSIDVLHMIVTHEGNLAHAEYDARPGTPEYDEVIGRHPNLKIGESHRVSMPMPSPYDPNKPTPGVRIRIE